MPVPSVLLQRLFPDRLTSDLKELGIILDSLLKATGPGPLTRIPYRAADIGAVSLTNFGPGLTGRVAEWTSPVRLGYSTLTKTGAGVLTLSAAGNYTLTVPASGTVVLGSGSANRVTVWDAANSVTGYSGLQYSANNDLWVGVPNSALLSAMAGRGVFVARDAAASGAEYIVERHLDTPAFAGLRAFVGSGTISAPGQTIAGHSTGIILSGWDDSSSLVSPYSAAFRLVATENWTTAARGADAVWELTRAGQPAPVERMRLTGQGYLGIGTSGPQAALHVIMPNDAYAAIFENTGNLNITVGPLQIRRTRSDTTPPGAGFGAEIITMMEGYVNNSIYIASSIRTIWENDLTSDLSSHNSAMIFITATNAAFLERMRLTSQGRLGISTTAPQAMLHVVQSAADYTAIFENDVADNIPYSIIQMRRTRSDATAPGAGFGAGMAVLLEGATNNSLAVASAIRTVWEVNQTNDTTDRDSAMVFMTMQDNVLAEKMRLTSGGRLGVNFVPSNSSPAITTITPNAAGTDFSAVLTSNRSANDVTWVVSRHMREDTTAPGAYLGAGFLAQLEGFTNNSIANAGWIAWQWLNAQTNDAADRNSIFTLALTHQGVEYNQAVWVRGITDFYSSVPGGAHTLGVINSAGSGFRRSEVRFSVFDGSSGRPLFGIFADSSTNPTTDQSFTIHDWVAGAGRLRIYSNGTLAFGQHLITPSAFTVTWNETEWPVRARVAYTHAATSRITFHCQRSRGTLTSPSAVLSGDYIGGITAGGYDGTDWRDGWNGGAEIIMYATQNWSNTARGAGIQFLTTPNGGVNSAVRMTLHNGLQVGAPTGGDKGVGTINVSGDIFKNNTAYNNPDYALEAWVAGKITAFADRPGAQDYRRMTLEEIEEHIRQHLRLPRIGDGPMGLFERSDWVLEKIEELFTYLIELNKLVKEKL